ncbi:endonuclease [Tenacibaculum adriaticum]|nr:endonuclease [Tenacibaculum adriaticum]
MKKLLLKLFFLIAFVANAQQDYYDDVNLALTGTDLKNALAVKITATHINMLTYTPGVWEASKITDINSENNSEVVLIYGWENGSDTDISNDRGRDKTLQDSGNGATFVWNREHVFSKSLANPSFTTDNPGPGTDAHNLRPADKTRNSTRNNYKFASGTGNSDRSSVTYSGPDGPNTRGWYPGDEWKGDVARIIMYMYLRYGNQCLPTNVGVGDNQFTPDDMIDLFLQWNVEDPVSEFEKIRNEYHENTTNTYAQGNRNPFIDNPYLATRIWGGDSAQDLWGIYTSSDNEVPTVPTNVVANNITMTTIDFSWDASSDNVAVTGYDIFVDGILKAQTTATNITISGLTSNTTYAFTVLAKDLINNKSAQSTAVNATTLQDSEAPTIPTNLVASDITDTSFRLTWDASSDNVAVTSYDIYLDGVFNVSTTDLTYNITGLNESTLYSASILAKDNANNISAQTASIDITTTDGSAVGGATELFISEYTEPNGGNNKAIEIVNLTGSTVSLVGYSIKKQKDGAGNWIDEFDISTGSVTSIVPNDVFVIINEGADDATLVAEADLIRASNTSTNYGSPINFNGNDPVGLFKNGILVDIVGDFDGGSGNQFAQNVTLRRKSTISSPNTVYDVNEWDTFPENTFDGIGFHSVTLSTESQVYIDFKVYPNPSNTGNITIQSPNNTEIKNIKVYSILGEKIVDIKNPDFLNNKYTLENLKSGIYLMKLSNKKQSTTKKLIVR